MSKEREVRCYDYVNKPYEVVREALSGDSLACFQNATRSAVARSKSVAAELRINVVGLDVAKDIDITVSSIKSTPRGFRSPPTTTLQLEWQASDTPTLFPVMKAELGIYPLTGEETQLEFIGHYEPPLGALGTAIDAVVGRRVADACVHRFVADIIAYLRSDDVGATPRADATPA